MSWQELQYGLLKRFELHKWNSNVPELEADNQLTEDSQTYAKEQLGGGGENQWSRTTQAPLG